MLFKLDYKKYLAILVVLVLFSYAFFDGVADMTESSFLKIISILFLIYSAVLYFFKDKIEAYLRAKIYDTKTYDVTYDSSKSYYESQGKYDPLVSFLNLILNDAKMIFFGIIAFCTWEMLLDNHLTLLSLALFTYALYGVLRSGKWIVKNYLRAKREPH